MVSCSYAFQSLLCLCGVKTNVQKKLIENNICNTETSRVRHQFVLVTDRSATTDMNHWTLKFVHITTQIMSSPHWHSIVSQPNRFENLVVLVTAQNYELWTELQINCWVVPNRYPVDFLSTMIINTIFFMILYFYSSFCFVPCILLRRTMQHEQSRFCLLFS